MNIFEKLSADPKNRRDNLSTDYEDRCGNCHAYLKPEDKYCARCGTARGKGEFLPYDNQVYCVYGPPIEEVFVCADCGHRWTAFSAGGSRTHYCPQCGSDKLTGTRERAMRRVGRIRPDEEEKPE